MKFEVDFTVKLEVKLEVCNILSGMYHYDFCEEKLTAMFTKLDAQKIKARRIESVKCNAIVVDIASSRIWFLKVNMVIGSRLQVIELSWTISSYDAKKNPVILHCLRSLVHLMMLL